MLDYQMLIDKLLDGNIDDEIIIQKYHLHKIIENFTESEKIHTSQIIYFRRPALYGKIFEDLEKKNEDVDDLRISINHQNIPNMHIFSKFKLCCQRHDLSTDEINEISADINDFRPEIGEEILKEIILPYYFQKETS